jgi:hypothetical protein
MAEVIPWETWQHRQDESIRYEVRPAPGPKGEEGYSVSWFGIDAELLWVAAQTWEMNYEPAKPTEPIEEDHEHTEDV